MDDDLAVTCLIHFQYDRQPRGASSRGALPAEQHTVALSYEVKVLDLRLAECTLPQVTTDLTGAPGALIAAGSFSNLGSSRRGQFSVRGIRESRGYGYRHHNLSIDYVRGQESVFL